MKRVLIALIVCLLVGTGCEGPESTTNHPTRISDLAQGPVDLTRRCPPIHHRPAYAPGGQLPDGAILVRMCSGWISKQYAKRSTLYSYDDPRDALTQGVQPLIEQVNSLDTPEPPPGGGRVYCSGVGRTPIEFWFGYPDGRAAVVRSGDEGCGLIDRGTGPKFAGILKLRDSFSAALARQREQTPARTAFPAPRCNPSAQPLTALSAKALPPLGAVTYCVLDARGRWRSAPVPQAIVRRLNEEAVDGHAGRGCAGDLYGELRARTTFGDRVDLYPNDCRWSLPATFMPAGHLGSWRPSVTLSREIQALPLGPPHRQRKPDGTLAGQ